ncbi:ATP-binding cassette domain-containing protein [Fluviispira sanaruensis]|uniref:ABC transporter permease n=1 Tax=Fluviispira sanaruensis TaxID=2493639 RepID=A0A4P2VMH1_FLUSA|nr:ABC transporter ATP-binding protein [Fluviispira sanaruensis]BBH54161.1 ABC transporter permease [Fluviispira sanaruensis]
MTKNLFSSIKNNLFLKILFLRPHFRFTIFLISLLASIASILIPYYQKNFINSLSLPGQVSHSDLFIYMTMVFVCGIIAQSLAFLGKYISFFEANFVQKWLSKVTYNKTFIIKNLDKNNLTVGQVLSIYASDIQTASTLIDDVMPNITSYILPILLAPIAIIMMTNLNPVNIFILLISLLIINFLMAIKQGKFFYRNKLYAAIRVGYVNEWLQNMRAIRMLNWITAVEDKIKQARFSETKNRLAMVTNGSTMNSLGYTAPFFINIFSVYILIKLEGNNINPGEIFSLLWIFGVLLTRPLRMLPMTLVTISDCYTSIKRIENYWSTEMEAEISETPYQLSLTDGSSIKVKNLRYSIGKNILLEGINIDIKKNEFVAIIGELGAGKSSLISALMNLNNISYDEYNIENKSVTEMKFDELKSYFTYVPQNLFIINSTLRDNVAFEYNYPKDNDSKILEALELSQFIFAKENLEKGLDTEIGERGVNLSGGQKQRVSIARAYYAQSPIVILDDCLSALDVRTEKKLNDVLLNGAWKNKTKILVTHRLSILPHCHRVIFMKNGKIVEDGPFQEIMQSSKQVRDFVMSLESKD